MCVHHRQPTSYYYTVQGAAYTVPGVTYIVLLVTYIVLRVTHIVLGVTYLLPGVTHTVPGITYTVLGVTYIVLGVTYIVRWTTYTALCIKQYSIEQCDPHSPKPFLEQKSSVTSGPNCTPHPRLLGARPFYTVSSEIQLYTYSILLCTLLH